ncbi:MULTISPECIES: hypothetical protein [unclassified Bradyrhizobium]|uniref:hypothetical protein n=2 Tax=unclassified Bradyrhizobium TaxID=2631580 RepID=UPI0028E86064|nr:MULTISPECIES: hypothetical protein [unclassified Bradyrhizobium]
MASHSRYSCSLSVKAAAMSTLMMSPVQAADPQFLPPVTVDAPDRPPSSPLRPAPSGTSVAPILGGRADTSAGKRSSCADGTVTQDGLFDCINVKLRRKVDTVNPSINQAPIDARSSDLKVGTVNVPAVQQQYGSNFGRSVVPLRPTAVFPSGFGRR